MNAHDILNNPFLNKGTAFTMEERSKLGLIGLLPPYVQTIEEQAKQTYAQMQTKSNNLEKRLFLMQIFNTNRTLFYYMFSQHLAEFNPIVYDPTIADTIENYSDLFIDPQYAAYLDINHPENIEATLKNAAGDREIRLIVVTDAEGILGIGEPLMYGVTLPLGKPFLTASLGAGFGGIMISLFHVGSVAQGVSGILGFLIVNEGGALGYLVGYVTAIVAAFIITYFFGWNEEKVTELFG